MHKDGNSNVTFNVAATLPQGSPHTIALDKTQIKVKAHGDSMIAARADFYSWGLEGKGKSSDKKNPVVNLASAGVQSFPGGGDSVIVFAVNTEEDGCRTPAAEHAGAGRRAGPRGAPALPFP